MYLISAEGCKNAGVLFLRVRKTGEIWSSMIQKLNTKTNKNVYVKNDVMSTVIKRCRGEKKKRLKKNRWIQKKIDDSRI